MAKLLWNDQALADLDDIFFYIAMDNPEAAERMYTDLEARAKSLLGFPRAGVRCRELSASARMVTQGAYLILYKTHPDADDGPVEAVEVMRVVQGNRELTRLLG